MRISVVIPCHNAASYLAQTVGSVIDQNWAELEIIIVDDASTDESRKIAERLALACPSIQLFERDFRSASAARNFGAAHATGSALMFLDADDVLEQGVFAAMADGLEAEDVDMVAVAWRRLDLVGGEWISTPASCERRRADESALSAWLRGWYYPPCAVMWRSTSFRRFGPWPEQLRLGVNDDGLLMMSSLCRGAKLAERTDTFSYYRRLPTAGSLSSRRSERDGLLDRADILAAIFDCLDTRGQLRSTRKSLREAYHRLAEDAAQEPDLAASFAKAARSLTQRSDAIDWAVRKIAQRVGTSPAEPLTPPHSVRAQSTCVTAGLETARKLMERRSL